MNKHLLSLTFVALVVFGASAETSVLEYTYAEGEAFAFGKGKKETIDVAMCINDPSLVGMKVKGFKAYITTSEGICSPSLWMGTLSPSFNM